MKLHLSAGSVASRVLWGALLLAFACSVTAQKSRPKLPDETRLRAQFVNAFGNDFNLVKSEFKTRSNARGGGTYWLAYLEPKRTGYFFLQHRYKDSDPLYSHVEQEIRLSVGPKGCHRGSLYTGVYSRFCLGDTIIYPVRINDFTHHAFKLVKAEYSNGDQDWETLDNQHPETRGQELDQTPVANPAAENLRYVGRISQKAALHFPGYTLQWRAVFEAVKPGRFNLELSSSSPGPTSADVASPVVPIIVVAHDAPVTLIAGHEEERGFTRGSDGRERLRGGSGNSYTTNLIILQPGDRISLSYYTHNTRFERGQRAGLDDRSDPTDDIKPVIRLHPFSLDRNYNINEWLIDHLPG